MTENFPEEKGNKSALVRVSLRMTDTIIQERLTIAWLHLFGGSQKCVRARPRTSERVRYAVRSESGFISGGQNNVFANPHLRLHAYGTAIAHDQCPGWGEGFYSIQYWV